MINQAEIRASVGRALNPYPLLAGSLWGSVASSRASAAISAWAVLSQPSRTARSQPPPEACGALGGQSAPVGGSVLWVGVECRGLWRIEQAQPHLGLRSSHRLQHRAAPLAKCGLPPLGAPASDQGMCQPPRCPLRGGQKRTLGN